MMGAGGVRRATELAILNANYIAARLAPYFPVLYRGARGRVAHECILDLRKLKPSCGVSAEDVAKRLMDYGFHSPTLSFPVADTLMVEPTESESKEELDRFCDAMIAIHAEVEQIRSGAWDRADNPLKNAPHTALELAGDWKHPLQPRASGFPAPVAARGEVLAAGEAHRQRRRRPQPHLHLPADRGVCLKRGPSSTGCTPSSERASPRSRATRCRCSTATGCAPSTCTRAARPACSTSRTWARCASPARGLHAALERALPLDFEGWKPGVQRYSLLLNERGGIEDDLMVTRAAR